MSNTMSNKNELDKEEGTTSDLSQAIEGSVAKEPGEEVRSIWLFGDNYRCNWWRREASLGPEYLNLGKISRSKFLKATMADGKLVIEDLSRQA